MKFVNYKILIGSIILIGLAAFLINVTKELFQIQQGGSVVKQLQEELSDKKNQNKFLKEQLKYVQTNDFIEKESRDKLGLVKQGEVVVQEKFNRNLTKSIEENLEKPNWKQWIDLFM